MHHVHLHIRMGIADATRHSAQMLAINQHGHSQRFKNSLGKRGNQMGSPLLVLQSPCEIPRDTGELGQSQYLFIGNVGDGPPLPMYRKHV